MRPTKFISPIGILPIVFWLLIIIGLVLMIKFSIQQDDVEYEQTTTQESEQRSIDFKRQKELVLQDRKSKQKEYHEYELKMIQVHKEADELRLKVKELDKQIYWTPELISVMDKICELSKDSPMCWDYEMLNDLKEVAEKRNVNYKILLWIMYWESHIWVNFKPYNCRVSNNWAGLKARKYDDWWLSEWYNIQYAWLNNDLQRELSWCWLYYFEDVHTFFESLANTIGIGYAKCNGDIYCISKSYVWHESWAWVNNVWKFLSIN